MLTQYIFDLRSMGIVGERPIRHVPSSTFALANLSPFQVSAAKL